MVDFARVQKELQECNRDVKVSGISVKPVADSLSHLVGTIPGPIDTPYEGGTFSVDIVLPDGYPFEPPKMRFATKVWESNAVADYLARSAHAYPADVCCEEDPELQVLVRKDALGRASASDDPT